MESKLTLRLNSGSIKRAKQYISTRKGNSLSKLVESYFNSLTSSEESLKSKRLPPIVSSLAGVIRKREIKNVENEYTGYLIEKYK